MNAIATLETSQLKTQLPQIRVGDTVRVHQRISEGKKSRIQIFEGLVIRYRKTGSLQAFITVRKIASGIGVEKSWFVHSPTIEKIQVVKRSKVRRAFLSYMRDRRGKSARLAELGFDKDAINASDHRTSAQIDDEKAAEKQKAAEEAQAEIKADVDASGDDAASDDALNDADTGSADDVAKEENKEAAKDDPTPSEDNVPEDATQDDKVNSDGNDEQQLAAEEAQDGVKAADKE